MANTEFVWLLHWLERNFYSSSIHLMVWMVWMAIKWARQPADIKYKLNNHLRSSPKTQLETQDIRALHFWEGLKCILKIIVIVQCIMPARQPVTSYWRDSQPSLLEYWCKSLGYIRNLKSYRIKASRQKKKKFPCWAHVIHHPELQLELSVIVVPP